MHNPTQKVVPYSITSVGHGGDPGFLAVYLQVTQVINPVVGCRYFLPERYMSISLTINKIPRLNQFWPFQVSGNHALSSVPGQTFVGSSWYRKTISCLPSRWTGFDRVLSYAAVAACSLA